MKSNLNDRLVRKTSKPLVVTLLTLFFAMVPFLFWRATWFGGKLTDAEIERYLHDRNARTIQHALAQAAEHMIKGDSQRGHSSWYESVAATADHPRAEIRSTAAWVMGQDNSSPGFHAALLRLIHDPEPLVRRNAALSLVRFGDMNARPELLEMLRPYPVRCPGAGRLSFRTGVDETVNPGTLLARVVRAPDNVLEIRSPLPGRVLRLCLEEGQSTNENEPVVELAPAPDQVWEALRALVLVGRAQDLAEVEKVGREFGGSGFDARLRQQLELTLRAIRSRT
jgi:hypothetical protein